MVAGDAVGMVGVGLLFAVVVGGHFAWVGLTGYFVVVVVVFVACAVAGKWAFPWTWPARPGHDVGDDACAVLLLVVRGKD